MICRLYNYARSMRTQRIPHILHNYLNNKIFSSFTSDTNNAENEEGVEEKPQTPVQKKTSKKSSDRWTHDFYDESEQAPKSRTELVNSYGYDIRNEDGPPRTRRNRRYK